MNADGIQPPSKLLKVARIDPASGMVHARQQDGMYVPFTVTSGPLPDRGDVTLLSDQRRGLAPSDLWLPGHRSIAVVRHVADNGKVLVDDGITVRQVANPDAIPVALLNTVELGDDGIEEIIAPTPIRSRQFGDEAADIEKEYRVDTSGEGPKFADFGGYPEVVRRARQLIDTQLGHRDHLDAIGARPVKGVLFTGAPGTGKTHLARIIAHESSADFYLVSGPTVVSKWVGDSEETLRKIFQMEASDDKRAIIFFDEIDSIAERRGSDTHEASRRLVAQLLTLMDGFDKKGANAVVIAATNRVDALDPALTRPGRFDWEIEFGMPKLHDRYEILQVGARHLQTHGELPFEDIAQLTECK